MKTIDEIQKIIDISMNAFTNEDTRCLEDETWQDMFERVGEKHRKIAMESLTEEELEFWRSERGPKTDIFDRPIGEDNGTV